MRLCLGCKDLAGKLKRRKKDPVCAMENVLSVLFKKEAAGQKARGSK